MGVGSGVGDGLRDVRVRRAGHPSAGACGSACRCGSLMVVDEAHRTSGDGSKPWAAVHDQQQIPAVRRLYMTATARIWEAEGDRPRLVASMEEDSPVFGPVAYKLTVVGGDPARVGGALPGAVSRHPRPGPLRRAHERGHRLPGVRGARLAAVQTGLMRAAVEERFRRVLSFHSRISEAEAMAAGAGGRGPARGGRSRHLPVRGAGVGGLAVRRARPRSPASGAG